MRASLEVYQKKDKFVMRYYCVHFQTAVIQLFALQRLQLHLCKNYDVSKVLNE